MSQNEDGQYICEECGKRRATVHLTKLVEGTAIQRHLCEECYTNKEGNIAMTPAAVFAQILAAVAPELKELSMKQCSACGMSYLEFRQRGVLGCPNDYEVFEKPLSQLLEQIHGSTRHCGKVPPQAGEREAILSKLRSLRRQQEEAVAQENYELAAQLRDRIQELEAKENELDEPEG